jgi:lipopolysaccharide transport system ATP-binding protein
MLKGGKVAMFGPTDEVVAAYLEDLAGDAESEVGQREDREGSGEVRVISVTVRDRGGQPVSSVRCGEVCYLDFAYTATKPLKNLALAWNVRDQLGQPLFRVSSADSGHAEGDFPPRGTLRCLVPRLPLIPGRYHGTIEVRLSGIVADYVQGAFTLVVEGGDFFGTGRINSHSPILLDHSWLPVPGE